MIISTVHGEGRARQVTLVGPCPCAAQKQALQKIMSYRYTSWPVRPPVWIKSSHCRLFSLLNLMQIDTRCPGFILHRLEYLFPSPHFRVQTCPRGREESEGRKKLVIQEPFGEESKYESLETSHEMALLFPARSNWNYFI